MEILSSEQRAIQAEAADFVDRVIRPAARDMDRARVFPENIFRECGERGYFSLAVKPQRSKDATIVLRELSKGLGSLGLITCAHAFQCCRILQEGGSKEIRDTVLRSALAGETLLSFALTEESGGSDALGISTIAIRDGEGWLINGDKCWITSAPDADAHLVVAKTAPGGGNKGISIFLVDKKTPGLSVTRIPEQHGMNASPTGNIHLNNCRVPADALIGVENNGYPLVKSALSGGRLAISAVSIGIAQDAMERAIRYSTDRSHFGRPISSYQGVSFLIADMYTDITLANSMMDSVIRLMETSMPVSADLAALKYHASEMCKRTCQNALQILGGNGFNMEYEVERLLRDSQMLTIGEGTSQICKVIISNALFNGSLARRAESGKQDD